MKILLVSDCKVIGGTEVHIIEFVKLLLKDEINIEIITTSTLSSKLKDMNIIIHEISFDDTFIAANSIKTLVNNKVDVIIAFRWKAIVSSAIAFRKLKITKIASVHSEFIPGSRYDNENKPDVEQLPKIINKYYEGIITPSLAIKNSLIKYGVNENKIVVIKSFINRLDSNVIKSERNNDKIILGYFGRLSKEKGVDMLPQICTKLIANKPEKQWELYLYGQGGLESSLLESIRIDNLEQKMVLNGFTDKPFNEMREIDILVVPSRQEGLGAVIVEAMSLGIPVVSFKVGGIDELIDNGCNGYLIQQYDLDQFAEKLKILIENEILRKELSNEALRTSVELYDYNKLYRMNKDFIIHSMLNEGEN